MTPTHAATTSQIMADADLRGIDTHGMSMLPVYEERRHAQLTLVDTAVTIVSKTANSVLVDGGGGLGYVPSMIAIEQATEMALSSGICVAAVRNSAHFGAAGYYTRHLAQAGLIGIAATSCSKVQVVPTYGAEPKLSTDPISFAAPAKRNNPFVLDMATSTAASGKVRNRATEGKPLPVGWAVDSTGKPVTDSASASNMDAYLTPLGGTPELSSHKGYGLAMMVNILTTCLSGGSLVTSENHTRHRPGSQELNHFFLVMRPDLFRPVDDFQSDIDDLMDGLRATKPIDPAQPVLVAGDPEEATKAKRLETGIPVPPGLLAKLRKLASACDAPFLLDA